MERLNRPMSDTESQERMVLWKLRSSVARHISSPGGGMVKDVDTTEQGMCANWGHFGLGILSSNLPTFFVN